MSQGSFAASVRVNRERKCYKAALRPPSE